MPVAQAIVLRRVLMGGISTSSGCLFCVLPSTDPFFEGVLERWGTGAGGLVFGTLLGPEATGPGMRVPGFCLFLVSWLHRSCMYRPFLWGCLCGVCGLGLLFENYIVDASIFYKKQFPRI